MCSVRALSPALAKRAAQELNEDPQRIAAALQEFRQWILVQKQIRARTTDTFLIVFLRAAKYNMDIAKERLLNYYTYRQAMPELFQERFVNLPKYKAILKTGSIIYLTEPISEDGPRVIIIRPNKFNLKIFSILDVFKLGAMLCDILLQEDDNAVVAGYVMIMDLTNIPKSLLLNFEPNFTRKITILVNKASPARMKGFHFLNVPTFFEKLFSLIKSVVHAKLRNRFYAHGGNIEQLYPYVPQQILPTEYGGKVNLDSLQEHMWQKLQNYQEFLLEEDNYGLIKPPSDFGILDPVFGAQGSFRSLNID